jgi:hypothetical protein
MFSVLWDVNLFRVEVGLPAPAREYGKVTNVMPLKKYKENFFFSLKISFYCCKILCQEYKTKYSIFHKVTYGKRLLQLYFGMLLLPGHGGGGGGAGRAPLHTLNGLNSSIAYHCNHGELPHMS